MKFKSNMSWFNILIGVLYIILGFFMFSNPIATDTGIIVLYALLVIARGVSSIITLFIRNNHHVTSGWHYIIIGVFDLFVGYLLLSNIYVGLFTLGILVALWLLATSFIGLVATTYLPGQSGIWYWLNIVLYLIAIVISISLLFNPIQADVVFAFLVAFTMFDIGALLIVEEIVNR